MGRQLTELTRMTFRHAALWSGFGIPAVLLVVQDLSACIPVRVSRVHLLPFNSDEVAQCLLCLEGLSTILGLVSLDLGVCLARYFLPIPKHLKHESPVQFQASD